MLASKENVKVGNTIIFSCDEFRNNDIQEFDGHVLTVNEKSVSVVYLSGYKSRNDDIPWSDILAKLDKRKPYTKLTNALYSGHFVEFTKPVTQK